MLLVAFATSDHTKRDRLFTEIINNVSRQLFAKQITLPAGEDPSANTDFFLWHTWFSNVFDKGGFDIVIGNPPYIQLQNSTGNSFLNSKGKLVEEKLGDLYAKKNFKSFEKRGDILPVLRNWHQSSQIERNLVLYYVKQMA